MFTSRFSHRSASRPKPLLPLPSNEWHAHPTTPLSTLHDCNRRRETLRDQAQRLGKTNQPFKASAEVELPDVTMPQLSATQEFTVVQGPRPLPRSCEVPAPLRQELSRDRAQCFENAIDSSDKSWRNVDLINRSIVWHCSLLITMCLACQACAQTEGLDEQIPPNIATRTTGRDWPGFLGPNSDGRSTETSLDWEWPNDSPPIKWQIPLGTGYAGPSISRGRLFHFDRHGDNNRLTCRNAETGEGLWTYEYATDYEDLLQYNNGPRCAPVVDGPRVYVFGQEGDLHCVRVSDGKRIWLVDTVKQFNVVQNFFGVGSTPVVYGDWLIVQVGGSPPGGPANVYAGFVKAADQCVVAFDKRTGKVVYAVGDELSSYASPVIRTIGQRDWGFVVARGGLLAFNPATGVQDFHFPWRATLLESVNAASPVVVGNHVLISECYGPGAALLSVKRGGFDVVWQDEKRSRKRTLQTHWCTPIHHDGYVYASSGRHSGNAELRCVELTTGKIMWSEPGLRRASLIYADGRLIVLGEDGVLRILRANSNKYDLQSTVVLRNSSNRPLLKYPAWTPPVLAHGLLYVRGDDRLVCLNLNPRP